MRNRAYVATFTLATTPAIGATGVDTAGSYFLFDGSTEEIIVPFYPGGSATQGLFGSSYVAGNPQLSYGDDWRELVAATIRLNESDPLLEVIFLF